MTQEEVFSQFIAALGKAGVSYMLTGGVAVNFYGRPRLTHDLDVVVELKKGDVGNLAKILGPKFFLEEKQTVKVLAKGEMANIIHPESGLKIDLWPLKDEGYDRIRFRRRLKKKIFGRKTWLISPEDLIIGKLLWFKDSDIQKHFEDAVGICQIQKDRLDFRYLQKWAGKQKFPNLLGKLREQSK